MTPVVVKRGVAGNLRQNIVQITGPASYTTNGHALTPAQVGLEQRIDSIVVEPVQPRLFQWDHATQKMKSFEAAGTETAAATNLSAVVARAVVTGL